MWTMPNLFQQSTSLTVRLPGSSAGQATLYVDGVDHGDSATLNSIPTGENESVGAAVKCRDLLVGSSLTYEIDYRLPTSGSHTSDVTIVASNGTALQTFSLTHQGATTTQENYTLNSAATTYLKNNGELYFTIENGGNDGLVVTPTSSASGRPTTTPDIEQVT